MLEFSDLYRIEQLKTIVANGRLFNVMMFVLVLFIAAQIDIAALWLAFAPILSIGTAYLTDRFGRFEKYLSIACIAFAVAPFLVIFYI